MVKLPALFFILSLALIFPASAGDAAQSDLGAVYQKSDSKIRTQRKLGAQREKDEQDFTRLSSTAESPIVEQRHIIKKNDSEYLIYLSYIDLKTFESKSLVYRMATKTNLVETGYTSGGKLNEGSMTNARESFVYKPEKSSWSEVISRNLLASSRFPIQNLFFDRFQRVRLEVEKLKGALKNAITFGEQKEIKDELAFLHDAEGEITLSPEAHIGDPAEYFFKVGKGGYIESLEVHRDGILTERLTNQFVDTPIDFSLSDSEIGSRVPSSFKQHQLKAPLLLGFRSSQINGKEIVSQVMKDTPAKLVGIKPGDEIVSMSETHNHPESAFERSSKKDYLYRIEVRSREGETRTLELRPVSYLMGLPKEERALAVALEGLN